MILMNLFSGKEWSCRCREWTCGRGRVNEWRKQHQRGYTIAGIRWKAGD